MDITNICMTNNNSVDDRERIHIIKNMIGREGIKLIQMFTDAEQEAYRTVEILFTTFSKEFRPQCIREELQLYTKKI